MPRQAYRVNAPRTLDAQSMAAFVAELNRGLADISMELARVQGLDGHTPKLFASLDTGGNRITGLPFASHPSDPCTLQELRENALYAAAGEEHSTERLIIARGGVRTGVPAVQPNDLVPKKQLEETIVTYIAAAAATAAPPEVEDASALGAVTTRYALEDHTHSGVNLGDAQTITGTKTFNTGGAPFAVGSTTKVVNLNADLLDGLDSTAFLLTDPDLVEIAALANVRGDLLYTDATPAWNRLPIGAANRFLGSDGTDVAWTAPGALTRVDDTNVTLTLGGTPATALLRAASLTLGWTGQLALGRGGTGINASSVTDLFNQLDPLTTRGDLLTRDATNSIRLAVGAANRVLRSDGTDPAWGQVVLTTDVSGVLPLANGGTAINASSATDLFNQLDPLTTRGDLITRDATNSVRLAIGTADQVLVTNGTDPSWAKLVRANAGAASGTTNTFVFATQPTFNTDITAPAIYGAKSSAASHLDLYANDSTFDDTNTGRIRIHERITFAENATVTATFNDAVIDVQGTITNSATLVAYRGFHFRPTINYSSALALAFCPAFQASPVFAPTATITDAFSPLMGFYSNPLYRPNAASITPTTGDLLGYYAAPGASITAGTSGTITRLTNYASYATSTYNGFGNDLGANITVTTLRGFHHGDYIGSGTATTHIGVDIEALAKGTTIIGIRNASSSVYTPVTKAITAATDTIPTNATSIRLNNTSGGTVTLGTTTPVIANGQNGQILVIFNSSANRVDLPDEAVTAGSNLRLNGGATYQMGQRDAIILLYSSDVGDWIEIGRSNN